MKRTFIAILTLLFFFKQTNAQDYYDDLPSTPILSVNTLFIEMGGNTSTPISINYERLLNSRKTNPNHWVALRTGYGYGPINTRHVVPVMVTFTSNPQGKSHLETGIGMIGEYSLENPLAGAGYFSSPYRLALGFSLMYKYQKKHDNGFSFRIGQTPSIYDELFYTPGVDPLTGHTDSGYTSVLRFIYLFLPGISLGMSF